MTRPLSAIVRYIKLAVTILMAAIFIWIVWFLYQHVYQTMTEAILVAELRSRVALTTVNQQELGDVLRGIAERQRPLDVPWSSLRNIFLSTAPAVAPAPSVTPPPKPDGQPTIRPAL